MNIYDFKKNRKEEWADVATLLINSLGEDIKRLYGQVNEALAYYSISKHRDFGLCTHFDFDFVQPCLFQVLLDCLKYTGEDSVYKFYNTAERIEFLECLKVEIENIWAY